mmetsp:Transcript_12981/g.18939  ORF Transcript_12981/g.18939 Transcript_12981/m.18939 type:complete len:435 (+) Transcript_12981:12-1316(+)
MEKVLPELVVKHRFDFPRIAEELGVSEEVVRKKWTEFYIQKTKKPEPKKPKKLETKPNLSIPEVTATEFLQSFRPRKNYLDRSGVDFTKQKSISVTGEEITPSGFCVLKHSLKDTFSQIRNRVQEYLPDIDIDITDEDEELTEFKVAISGDKAVFQSKAGSNWEDTKPSVPLPNFDDIKVIPDEDVPQANKATAEPLLEEDTRGIVVLKQEALTMFFDLMSCYSIQIERASLSNLKKNHLENMFAELGGVDWDLFWQSWKGRAFVFEIKGVELSDQLLDMAGHSNPQVASEGSIRKAVGTSQEDNKFFYSVSQEFIRKNLETMLREETVFISQGPQYEVTTLASSLNEMIASDFFELFEKLNNSGFKVIKFKIADLPLSLKKQLDSSFQVAGKSLVVGVERTEGFAQAEYVQSLLEFHLSVSSDQKLFFQLFPN